MKVDTFLKLYNTKRTDEEKVEVVKQIMKNNKVRYSDKVNRAGIIAQNSYHVKQKDLDDNEREVFQQNSAAKYMLYYLTLVDLYTNLDIDYKQSLETFEMLNGDIIDIVVGLIDDREKKEFQMLLEFACDDLLVNEYEPHAFIRSQVDRFGYLIGTTLAPALENMDLDKMQRLIAKYAR